MEHAAKAIAAVTAWAAPAWMVVQMDQPTLGLVFILSLVATMPWFSSDSVKGKNSP